MTFWIICAIMALAVAALLGLALWKGGAEARPAAQFDLQVYMDQLSEVDRDAARGVLSDEDAERARTEISRRVLAADKALDEVEQAQTPAARRLPLLAAAVVGVALIGGSLALYRDLGAPGYGDLPLQLRKDMADIARAERPSQAEAEASLPPFPHPTTSRPKPWSWCSACAKPLQSGQ